MARRRWLLTTLLLVAVSASASPLPTVDVAPMIGPDAATNLWRMAGIMIDRDRSLTINEVAATPAAGDRFMPTIGDSGNLGYVTGAVWLRFLLRNTASESRRVLLQVGEPRLDNIRFYAPRRGGGWVVAQSGDRTPFSERPYPYRKPIFPVTLAAHSSMTCYLRIVSQSAIPLPLRLFSTEYLATRVMSKNLLMAAIYGVIGVMALYNLVLFFGLRERSYFWYGLFGLGLIGFSLSLQGYGAEYLWPKSVWWSDRSLLVFGAITLLFALLFFRAFVQLVREVPRWERITRVLCWGAALMVPVTLFAPYRFAGETLNVLAGVSTLIPLFITGAIVVTRPSYPPARHLLTAWGIFLLIGIYRRLEIFGVVPMLLGEESVLIGGGAMMTLLSFGLAAKVDEIRRTNETAQTHLIAVQRDATARLEDEVEERTRAFRAARDEAERANRMKDEFVAIISHEIRNPLTATLGNARLLRDTGLNTEQAQLVEGMEQSGTHLQALLDDLLDLSRIEAGRLKFEYSVFSLSQLLDAAISSVRGLAEAKGLSLRLNSDTLPPRIYGDQRRTRQILINLLGNALKFTDAGEITVDAYELEPDGERRLIYLAVTDSGSGIADAQLAHLFLPFAQGDGVDMQHRGSGLGLAISKRLAEAMGGEIGVESTLGEGSIFWVVLPFDESPEAVGTETDDADAQMAPPSLSILFAEDEAMNRRVIAKLLEREGHRVTVVADGEEALAAVRREQFDLILMDVQMPRLDGIETTRQLRMLREFRRATTPVFALTATVRDATLQLCRTVGIDAVIGKPLDMTELNRLLCSRFGATYRGTANTQTIHMHGDALLDIGVLLQRWELLGAAAFDEIVKEYVKSSAKTMDGLNSAWNVADRKTIVSLAHRMAGTAGTIGLPLMMDFARRLESAAAGEHDEPLDPLLSQLFDCHEASLEALNVWRCSCAVACVN